MLRDWLQAQGHSGQNEASRIARQADIAWPENAIWLASYPRSGNTYLRALLWSCFRLQSGSIYPDDLLKKQGVASHVGHYEGASRGLFSPDFLRLPLVKTHEWPTDGRKAIYILREGVGACRSLVEYLRAAGYDVSLDDIIAGRHHFGSWSAHVLAWDPQARPDTLFLRFEQLTGDVAGTLARLSEFLGVQPVSTAPPQLMEGQSSGPQWLSPSRAPKPGLTPAQAAAFDALHGETMARFGYAAAQARRAPGPVKPVAANAAAVWLCWGETHLNRAVASARSTLPLGIDRILITDAATAALARPDDVFTTVVVGELPYNSDLNKSRLVDLLPAGYDTILYLDTDTIVLGDVTLGFEQARKHGIALAPAPHYNLGSFFGFDRIMGALGTPAAGQMQYNAGVIFCHLPGRGRQVLERFRDLCAAAPAGWVHDQPYLTLALEQLGIQPYVLSPLYNYRGMGELAVGDIRIWHSVHPPPADLTSGEPAWPPRRYRDGVRVPV